MHGAWKKGRGGETTWAYSHQQERTLGKEWLVPEAKWDQADDHLRWSPRTRHDSEKCLRHFYFFSIFGGFFAPNQWIVSGKHEYPCHIHTELGAVISVSGWKASPLVPSSCRQVDYNGDARRKKAGGGPIFGHFFSNMFEKHVWCESLLSTFWSVVAGLLPTGKIMMPSLSIFSENQ